MFVFFFCVFYLQLEKKRKELSNNDNNAIGNEVMRIEPETKSV